MAKAMSEYHPWYGKSSRAAILASENAKNDDLMISLLFKTTHISALMPSINMSSGATELCRICKPARLSTNICEAS